MIIQNSKPKYDWLLIAIAGIPALFFYYMLSKTVFNLPVHDDYSLLNFTNQFSQLNDLVSKLFFIINFQHNEYKLIFVNAMFAIQFASVGYIDFAVLSIIGNAFVVIIYVLLVKTFKIPAHNNLGRISLLMPVSLLLFQLQYASTLNFSMAGIQNLSVLVFALTAISLLVVNSKIRFAGACISLLLAICSSGNGFLLVPVGGFLLIQRKRWIQIVLWLILSIAIASIYFNSYTFSNSSGDTEGGQLLKILLQFNLIYILAFIGSSIAKYQYHIPSVGLGIVLLVIWAVAIKNKYPTKNPSAFYFFVFLFLTAIGVSSLRSSLGVEQSLASRYRIYSNLILILTYFFIVETYFERIKNKKIQYGLICIFFLLGAIFFTISNYAGYRFLIGRQEAITYEMLVWKEEVLKKAVPIQETYPHNLDIVVTRQIESGIYKPATTILLESIRLGVYSPID